jgi:hypothetical protein
MPAATRDHTPSIFYFAAGIRHMISFAIADEARYRHFTAYSRLRAETSRSAL